MTFMSALFTCIDTLIDVHSIIFHFHSLQIVTVIFPFDHH